MNVIEHLVDLGFDLDSYGYGKHECICPFCSASRKPHHQKQKCAAVWIEDDFATYNCIHCGEHGFVHSDKKIERREVKYNKPTRTPTNTLSGTEEFLKHRGISIDTAQKAGLYVAKNEKTGEKWLAFPFYKGGEIVNIKYRGIAEKKFMQEKNPEPVVYNYDMAFNALNKHNNELIIVEGECLKGTTEIFTENGWMFFSDYNGQRVLQINDDLSAELVKPLAIIKKHYSGNLLCRKNRNQNIVATPGHNIVYKTNNGKWQKRKFENMPLSIAGHIPTAVKQDGEGLPYTDDELRLFVAISADGSIDSRGHIRIRVKKDRKAARAKYLLKQCNINSTRTQNGEYKYFGFYYSGAFKKFPQEWLIKTTLHQKLVILQELVLWDGNKVPNRAMTEYASKEYDNAKFVQTLCHLAGFNSSIIRRKNQYGSWFKVTMLWNKNHTSWQRCTKTKTEYYDGDVFCVTVPSGKILIRNDEKITVIGNCDALTFIEAGFDNCVSIPAGSIGSPVEKNYNGSKFDFIKVSAPLFDSAKKIILALDNDDPGRFMTQALIDRFGAEKCFLVDWGAYKVQGKDANDFWRQDKAIIPDAINLAKPIPIRGIKYAVSDPEGFIYYLLNGVKDTISSGFENLDRVIKFAPGNFVTLTGNPGSGKSLFLTSMIMNMAKKYGIKTLYCAFENSENQLMAKWAQILLHEPVFPMEEYKVPKIRSTFEFMRNHFMIMEDETANLSADTIVEYAERAVRQEGVKIVIIDPLNKITFPRSESLTQDIGAMLNKIIAFTRRNNVITFLVAHPTKPSDRKLDEQSIPNGFDIAGSANFLNMSDIIMTVHRKQSDTGWKSRHLMVMISKVRDTNYGHEGTVYFDYNQRTGEYIPCTKEEFKSEYEPKDLKNVEVFA